MDARRFLDYKFANVGNALILCAIILSVVSCKSSYQPQNGDLVFRVGSSDFSEAIKSATVRGDNVPYTHIGMVMLRNDSVLVIEAGGDEVCITPYEEFISHAATMGDKRYVAIGRVDVSKKLQDSAVARALTFLGQPYDNEFRLNNGMMYCTELVWEAFLDDNGKHILDDAPMTFRSADGTVSPFWIKHFQELGVEMPEGEPGTNPVDMSHDSKVKIVYRYF